MTFKIDSHVKAPRIRKPKSQRTPEIATKAIAEYKTAFKRVYGVTPEMKYDATSGFVSDGRTSCSVKRLKELTTMLKARVE